MRSKRSTPFAILGMLSIRPMSGYDVRKEAATSIGYFWSESYGQIYPALRELVEEGLARPHAARPTGRADRQVYEITPAGRSALDEWLMHPPRMAPLRNELLLKLFFGSRQSAAAQSKWIEQALEHATARRKRYTGLRRALEREESSHPSLPFWLMTLSYGDHFTDAMIGWCRETLDSLAALEPTPAGSKRAAPRPVAPRKRTVRSPKRARVKR